MKNVNVEKFLADYESAVQELKVAEESKNFAIEETKEEVNKIVEEHNYPDKIREMLINELVVEKEKEFDIDSKKQKVEFFENYLEDVVEEEDEVATEDVDAEIEKGFDEF